MMTLYESRLALQSSAQACGDARQRWMRNKSNANKAALARAEANLQQARQAHAECVAANATELLAKGHEQRDAARRARIAALPEEQWEEWRQAVISRMASLETDPPFMALRGATIAGSQRTPVEVVAEAMAAELTAVVALRR